MRIRPAFLLLLLLLFLSTPGWTAQQPSAVQPQPVEFEFGGYRFGQSPAANMLCSSGYCKSQAPGGDGQITFPYSTYTTPGAVSTMAGLSVVNARYTYWDERLYRIYFQVDCTPLEAGECMDDIISTLDREFDLTPLSSLETQQFVLNRHVINKEYVSESGALIKVRVATLADGTQMPMVDIVDRGMANLVGSSISSNFKPKKIEFPEGFRQP